MNIITKKCPQCGKSFLTRDTKKIYCSLPCEMEAKEPKLMVKKKKEKSGIKFKKLNPQAILPKRATDGSAGYDLHVCLTSEITIKPNECKMLKTGFALWIEDNSMCALCIPRSGLGVKKGIVLGNLTGLIDSDYQGEWHIPVWNRSDKPVTIYPNDKICQCVFVPVLHPVFEEVDDFETETKRAKGGFGSTGVHLN